LCLALELQRGEADIRQRENVSAAIGLQLLLVDQLAADALDLPFKRNLGFVQIDRWPDKALRFAFAQAENKGAPSARQADRPRPSLAKDARDGHGERE
jgi:hypothetical protein